MARSPQSPGHVNGDGTGSKGKGKGKEVRKYGFACANCRKRKAKCDGGIPSCERCLSNGETCYFNKCGPLTRPLALATLTSRPYRVPSVTYSLALQARVDTCESLLKCLHIASEEERSRLLEEHFSGSGDRSGNGKRKRVSNTEDRQDRSATTEVSSSENELTEILNETSVDEDGRICFYGTTSSFHLQPDKVLRSQVGERPDTVRT